MPAGGRCAIVRARREAVARQAHGLRQPGVARTSRRWSTASPAPSRSRDGEIFSVGAFTVRGGKVVALDILADPSVCATLDLTVLDG